MDTSLPFFSYSRYRTSTPSSELKEDIVGTFSLLTKAGLSDEKAIKEEIKIVYMTLLF